MQFDDSAARNRFESFKLGKGLPPALKHTHARSHSRNASLSLPLNDFSFPNSLPSSPSSSATTTPIPNPNPIVPSKRNSHHRRRSSVSTRHESAELMGVALPDLPPSTSDDNINLGEKDSIRRRALWALEGKPDVSFNKVQIPDIAIPDIDKIVFDFSTKPSSTFSNALSASGKRDSFKLLGSSSSSKDQLGTLLEEEEEEEEEEKKKKKKGDQEISTTLPNATSALPPPPNTPISPIIPVTPALSITKATPSKPRPTNLNLRPLSLTPDNLPGIVASLPSPTPTPIPRQGLRSLSLTPSNADISSPDDISASSLQQTRRSSLVLSPTPNLRKPILNLALEQLENNASTTSSVGDVSQKPPRRSSISYKRSLTTINSAGLPTPEMTPTFSRRVSSSLSTGSANDVDEVFPNPPTPQSRPLSASEQHFLFKSHNALLARITDLERALSLRRRESGGYSNGGGSRPASVASNFSTTSSGVGGNGSEPSDEMLNLIADLKAERDELKRDVDGWRTRVADMENQMSVLTKRVENERREAWVARSRVGLLEVEKEVLTKKMNALDDMFAAHEKEKDGWESEISFLRRENEEKTKRIKDLEDELALVKQELEEEKRRMVEEKVVIDPLLTPTPTSFDGFKRPAVGLSLAKKHGLGFASLDSESSSTDVEQDSSDDNHVASGFSLKAVQEEPDEVEEYSEEEDNGLLGYEDEEDTDMSLQSTSSLSSDEEMDMPRSLAHLHQDGTSSPSTPKFQQVFTPPKSSTNHIRRATLSKTWTFPIGAGHSVTPPQSQANEEDSVDRFFGCLDDGENDTIGSLPSSPSAYSYEKSKGLFSNGFKYSPADDNASFFVIPDGVGTLASSDEEDKDDKHLSVVTEEVEDDDDCVDGKHETEADDDTMFGEIGGIRITFTPPQEEVVVEERKQIQLVSPIKRTSPPPVLPALDFGDDDEEEDGTDGDGLSRGIPFNFGRPLMPLEEREPSPPPAPVVVAHVSAYSRPSSPSMIPRPASPSSFSSKSRPVPSTSPNAFVAAAFVPSVGATGAVAVATPPSPRSFVTPPNKRGGASPSFIPQPTSSPSPLRNAPVLSKSRGTPGIPSSTFIPQPSRKPLLPSGVLASSSSSSVKVQAHSNVAPVNTAMNTRSFRRSSGDSQVAPAQLPPTIFFDGNNDQQWFSTAQMKSIDLSHDSAVSFWSPASHPSISSPSASVFSSRQSNASVSSNASSSISSIVSFQAISSLLPLSWGSRSTPSFRFVSVSQHSPAESLDDDSTFVGPLPASAPCSRPKGAGGYVSRKQQLERLRARMEVEGALTMKMQAQPQCRKCQGGIVRI